MTADGSIDVRGPTPIQRSDQLGHKRSLPTGGDRVFLAASVAVGVWALFLNFFKLGVPRLLVDEPIYSLAGWRYVRGETFAPGEGGAIGAFADNFEHPPLGKYVFGVAQAFAGSPSVTATRVSAALCTVAVAVALGLWVARTRGRWTGLIVAGVIALLPVIVAPSVVRFGRFGMLDNVAAAFAVAALIVASRWSRSTGGRAWLWALGAGTLAGLAASAKESGFLILVGPVLFVVWAARRGGEGWWQRLWQSAALAAAAATAFFLTYLPVGHPIARIQYMWEFQMRHGQLGHPVVVAGESMTHPPWWANLWFAWDALGPIVSILLALGVCAALVLDRTSLARWCAVAVAVPAVFLLFVHEVALSFYFVMWLPLVIVLAVIGWSTLIEALATGLRWPRSASVVAATALLLSVAVPAAANTVTTAKLQHTGLTQVESAMARHHLSGPIVMKDVAPFDRRNYLGRHAIASPEEPGAADTVVAHQLVCGEPKDRVFTAFIRRNLKAHALRLIYQDAEVMVYSATKPLTPPGYLDIISVQPPSC